MTSGFWFLEVCFTVFYSCSSSSLTSWIKDLANKGSFSKSTLVCFLKGEKGSLSKMVYLFCLGVCVYRLKMSSSLLTKDVFLGEVVPCMSGNLLDLEFYDLLDLLMFEFK